MAEDKNGELIKVEDMLKFKEGRHSHVADALGIVTSFSTVNNDIVFVNVCGGGGMGRRMITGSKSEIVKE